MAMDPLSAESRPLQLKDWIAFLAMTFGMFMAILDIQIVSSSLSEIQAGVSASADEIVWVQSSYLIAEVIMIPLSGFLSRVLSTRILFTLSCLGFTLASFMCALSENLDSLIFFRACQGFIGGAMIPTVFATSFIIFPPEKRSAVIILTSLVATMAPTLGPTIGGYLTNILSWHWLFLINVLPGIIVSSLVWFFVDFDKPDYRLLKGFDFLGLFLMALFLGSLEYILEEGPRHQWFEDSTIVFFFYTMLIAGGGFFTRVLLYYNPIVDIRAYKDANFALGSLFSFILGVGLYGLVYLLPFYLAVVRGFNALQIGMMLFVTGMFQFISGPIVGVLSKKFDLRILLTIGFIMFAINAYLCSFITADFGFKELFIPQALRGMSLMLCFIPINILSLGTLPKDKIKNASGLYNTSRNLGGAIGLALINTIIIERLAHHKARLRDHLVEGKPQVEEFIAGVQDRLSVILPSDPQIAATKRLYDLMTQQAYVLTLGDTFYLISLLFLGALFFIPFIKKPVLDSLPPETH
jgi:DHA2 family multidrug resistance protein